MLSFAKNKIALSVLAGCALIAISIQNIKPSRAANGAPTGACGAVMDISHKNVAPLAAGTSYGSNALLYIDFANNKISANTTVVTFQGVGGNGLTDTAELPTYGNNRYLDVNITVTPGPVVNTWIIQPAAGSDIPTIIALAVNKGNTYLLQSGDGRGTGVCQSV